MQQGVRESLQAIDTPHNRFILVAVAVVSGLALLCYVFRALQRRSQWRRLHQGIVSASIEYLHNVLVPDGMGASMHVDYLLLTARGVIVIDLRDVRGNIFGGDQMTDWTVMNGATRTTFHNPQHALYDRVAAVRALAGEIPVEGRILFTRRGRFPKGLPRWTLMLDSLRSEFPLADSDGARALLQRHGEDWRAIASAVSASTLRQRRPFIAEVFDEKF